jgi:hypothetical protein
MARDLTRRCVLLLKQSAKAEAAPPTPTGKRARDRDREGKARPTPTPQSPAGSTPGGAAGGSSGHSTGGGSSGSSSLSLGGGSEAAKPQAAHGSVDPTIDRIVGDEEGWTTVSSPGRVSAPGAGEAGGEAGDPALLGLGLDLDLELMPQGGGTEPVGGYKSEVAFTAVGPKLRSGRKCKAVEVRDDDDDDDDDDDGDGDDGENEAFQGRVLFFAALDALHSICMQDQVTWCAPSVISTIGIGFGFRGPWC